MAVCLFILMVISKAVLADPIDEGKAIFKSRCAACHNVNKVLTGPALAGVHERRSLDWIISFVHSSQTMVKDGDKDAVALFEQFRRVPMPDHPDLTDDNIKQIVEYIKSEARPVGEDKAPFATPTQRPDNARPLGAGDYAIFAIYIFTVIALIIVLLFAVHAKSIQLKKQEENISAG
jgi:cytochrome c551/c552